MNCRSTLVCSVRGGVGHANPLGEQRATQMEWLVRILILVAFLVFFAWIVWPMHVRRKRQVARARNLFSARRVASGEQARCWTHRALRPNQRLRIGLKAGFSIGAVAVRPGRDNEPGVSSDRGVPSHRAHRWLLLLHRSVLPGSIGFRGAVL